MTDSLQKLLRDRTWLFWTLNVAGWSGYAIAASIGALAHGKPDSYIALYLAAGFLGFVISLPMRYLYQKLWDRPVLQLALGMLVTSYVLGMIWRIAQNLLYYRLLHLHSEPETVLDLIGGVLVSFYVMACWSGLYFGIKYYQQLQEQTEQTLKATAAAHQAQLKMLRYQLNPHFLFNTLNAISTLVLDGSTRTANLAVSRLSDFLRYTLDNDPMKEVSLGSELRAIDLYLEIEKVRFGDRLIVVKEIEPEARDALVPSLILQPLIENAIKYAITPNENGGTLKIAAQIHSDMLMLRLSDNGPGLADTASATRPNGVGLENTRQRLQQFYGDKQAFTLAPNDPSGLSITINIPFRTHDDA